MKESPILFRPDMVAAIRAGNKTETRRVINWPWPDQPREEELDNLGDMESLWVRGKKITCPYGMEGDRLWVKERHAYLDVVKSNLSGFPLGPQNNNEKGPVVWNVCVEYSDGTENETSVEGEKPKQTRERGEQKWRSSLFMHRWASRLDLVVLDVSVERVQSITEAAVHAEGMNLIQGEDAVMHFGSYWNRMRAGSAYEWDRNPWVWVVRFRRA